MMGLDGLRVGDNGEWGVAITLPDGTVEYEPHLSASDAADAAESINDSADRRIAQLARRTVLVGGWMDNPDGNAWGCRHEWPDGTVEYEAAPTRAVAAERAEMAPPGAVTTVASRWLFRSDDWTLIGSDKAV